MKNILIVGGVLIVLAVAAFAVVTFKGEMFFGPADEGMVTRTEVIQISPTEKPEDPKVMNVQLFFPNRSEPPMAFQKFATRALPKSEDVENAALKALLGGPLPEEARDEFMNIFSTPAGIAPSTTIKPLGEYYKGVKVEGDVATVDFSKEAMAYLDAVPGSSSMVKWSIEKTLFQFGTIKKVQYSIDGKVVTEWDA